MESRVDKITLKEFFVNNNDLKEVGGIKYLGDLMMQATGTVDIRDYAITIIELWQKRQLEVLLLSSLADLDSKKFSFVSAEIENEIAGLATQEPKKKTQHVSEMLEEMENEKDDEISNSFIPTGFASLDDYLNGGIYQKQMMIIGARPSVGKTSIAQNIILNASKAGKRCLFISLEVDKRNVMLKFLSNLSTLENWKILKKRYNQSELESLQRAKQTLKQMEIYVNDSSYLKVNQIGRLIKNQIEKAPVDLVVVDYVQIIKGDDVKFKNEALIIKENTTMLKAFAKQYNVAVLALAQINRKAVEGANQEPTINDFKGSGGIEEDADVAIILHRDRSEDKKENYFSNSGKFIIAKNRHGRTGEIGIKFHGACGIFTEIEGL